MKDRRTFIKTIAALTAGMMLPGGESGADSFVSRDRLGALLPQRLLGKTGERVTMLGLGGAHVGKTDAKSAQALIETAIEGGVRFFDNAEMYNRGRAEEYYGKYLCPKYRDAAFVMTKSTGKTAKKAQEHFEGSLRRMKTDYVDLWQIHAIGSPSDVEGRIEAGVLDYAIRMKETGKARYIGFTGHSSYLAHLHMLEQTDVLDTCQMPINVFDANYKSFINHVLPRLVEKEIGVLAMKSLGNGGFFGGTTHFNHGPNPKIVPGCLSIREALHFVWSLPVSVLITGADDAPMLQEKIDLAREFSGMTLAERYELIERVVDFDGSKVEFYKS